MNSYYVYKHTSPSGKVYVGVTCIDPERRWKKGGGYWKNAHFRNAIKKYGWDRFEHEIVAHNLSREEALNKEVELIKQFKSYINKRGYNISLGGYLASEETKKKLSELQKRSWNDELNRTKRANAIKVQANTQETRFKKSTAMKAKWEDQNYRRRMSESAGSPERRAILSKAGKRRYKQPVEVAKQSERMLKIWCDPNRKHQRLEAYEKLRSDPNSKCFCPPVRCVETGEIFPSAREAQEFINMPGHAVHDCCNKKPGRLTAGGYRWEYVTNPTPMNPDEPYRTKTWKRVNCVETGEIFESIAIAAKCIGISAEVISRCCNKKPSSKTAGGYHWEWYNPSDEEATA